MLPMNSRCVPRSAILGYSLAEIQGKHHSMFAAPAERDSIGYREFRAKLNRGEFQSAECKRFGKGGKEVWILASYNPILDDAGKPFKVVKFASDVSEQTLKTADFAGQIEAIGKSQVVIEFSMDGVVLDANENFLKTLGYSFAEIKGKHHSMFVQPEEHQSDAYRVFWANLNRGEFQSAEYRRVRVVDRGGNRGAKHGHRRDVLEHEPGRGRQHRTGGVVSGDGLGSSLRANGSLECAPDDRLREAIQSLDINGLLRRFAPRNDDNRSAA
jgi:PAS domain S-box-containing protein